MLGASGGPPSAPNRSPSATPREVISEIMYLQKTYHFGPGNIADYLERFHQQSVAVSSVHRIRRTGQGQRQSLAQFKCDLWQLVWCGSDLYGRVFGQLSSPGLIALQRTRKAL